MAQKITNAILLGHIQTMKHDLQTQIGNLRIDFARMEIQMRQGFEEARHHRQALQEDLNATIRLQGKHTTAIARLSKKR